VTGFPLIAEIKTRRGSHRAKLPPTGRGGKHGRSAQGQGGARFRGWIERPRLGQRQGDGGALAREGAKVLAADINRDAALETKRIIDGEGGSCKAVSADVSQADDVSAMVSACIAAFGRIDVLHNNVGIVEVGGPVETTEESWDRVNDVNLKSMFLTCKQVLPHMEHQGKGAIVNLASVSGIRWLGVPYISYAATKAAVIQFTRVIALQYARFGIRANSILPGMMNTPMVHAPEVVAAYGGSAEEMVRRRDTQCPMGRMGDAWDVAYAALFLASDEAKYITRHRAGRRWRSDGQLRLRLRAAEHRRSRRQPLSLWRYSQVRGRSNQNDLDQS